MQNDGLAVLLLGPPRVTIFMQTHASHNQDSNLTPHLSGMRCSITILCEHGCLAGSSLYVQPIVYIKDFY